MEHHHGGWARQNPRDHLSVPALGFDIYRPPKRGGGNIGSWAPDLLPQRGSSTKRPGPTPIGPISTWAPPKPFHCFQNRKQNKINIGRGSQGGDTGLRRHSLRTGMPLTFRMYANGRPSVGRTVRPGLPLGPEDWGETSPRPKGAGAGPLAACPQGSVQP